ncbi:MAG TPA: metallophosphoesterase family protein [Anaerolineales bacterium]|nr:metallophosphoesterase family protein [Anaerolineales bacterium]
MTKVLVISDVHANITALEAVLADAGKVNEVWCLGDIAGYGPDPNECIERIQALPKLTCMMGNHDFAAIGNMALETFNIDAKRALLWQRDRLNESSKNFLRTLAQEPKVAGNVTLVHGSPRDPIWEYVMNTLVARINLAYFETLWCFVGHSHFQAVFQYHSETDDVTIEVPKAGERYTLKERALLNPGSVGQPRDRDPRAAYAFFYPKEKAWEPRRVEYDILSVQKRILEAGLPPRHAERLAGGW